MTTMTTTTTPEEIDAFQEQLVVRLGLLRANFCDKNETTWHRADYLFLKQKNPNEDTTEEVEELAPTGEDQKQRRSASLAVRRLQSIALFRWLFGNKAVGHWDTVILLRKDGYLWIFTCPSNKDWIQKSVSEKLPQTSVVYYDGTKHVPLGDILKHGESLWKSSGLARDEVHWVGFFMAEEEKSSKGFAGALEDKLILEEEQGRVHLVDAELGVCLIMACIDDLEMYYMERACTVADLLLKESFFDKILDCFTPDPSTRLTHAQLAEDFEKIFDPQSPKEGYVLKLPENERYGFYCRPVIQSGGVHDLSPDAENTDLPISDDIVTLLLGVHCEDYCCKVTRTYLFDATDEVKNIYSVLVKMRDVCLSAMTPGAPLKAVHAAAVEFLRKTPGFEYLENHLPGSLGCGIGLLFQDKFMSLTPANETLFRDGMVFCLSVCFQDLGRSDASSSNPIKYILSIADTVRLKSEGVAELLTTTPCALRMVSVETRQDASPQATTAQLTKLVKRISKKVEKEFEEEQYDQLQAFLHSKRDNVLNKFRQPASFAPVPAQAPRQQINEVASPSKHPSKRPKTALSISGMMKPVPESSLCVPVASSVWTEDSEELSFVPHIDEAEDDAADAAVSRLLSDHDTSRREELIMHGAECEQDRRNQTIDETLRRVFEATDDSYNDLSTDFILSIVAKVIGEEVDRIQARYDVLTTADEPLTDEANTEPGDSDESLDTKFQTAMDSYRNLWCRRCYTYDCNLHGLQDKQSPNIQLEQAVRKEASSFWHNSRGKRRAKTDRVPSLPQIAELSDFQKSLCKQMVTIMNGDVSKIARMLRAPEELIEGFIYEQQLMPITVRARTPPTTKLPYYNVKNYNKDWYRLYGEAEIFPFFFPCVHDGVCSEEICSCIDSSHFCTLACSWGSESPNFFRGCDCKGGCLTTRCNCSGANRECDPNLCQCNTCSDPPNELANTQRCRNDNILMGRSRPTLIGRSSVAGWGLFTKFALKKDDYIDEYVGECITQEEADRRGQLDDARDRSYLFQIASDLVIDSKYKGNKTRFINHSDTPNVQPKILFIKGEQRAGFFALEDIPEQTELFFNYNYNQSMDNKHLKQIAMDQHTKWGNKKKAQD